MTPEERKNFWAKMSKEKARYEPFLASHEERIRRDWASLMSASAERNISAPDVMPTFEERLTKEDRAFLADLKVCI